MAQRLWVRLEEGGGFRSAAYRGHVEELFHVAVADTEGEDADALLAQSTRRRPRIAAVRVAVRHQKHGHDGVRSCVAKHCLIFPKSTVKVLHYSTVQQNFTDFFIGFQRLIDT